MYLITYDYTIYLYLSWYKILIQVSDHYYKFSVVDIKIISNIIFGSNSNSR